MCIKKGLENYSADSSDNTACMCVYFVHLGIGAVLNLCHQFIAWNSPSGMQVNPPPTFFFFWQTPKYESFSHLVEHTASEVHNHLM